MKLIEYFDRKRGLGVLSTADGDGKVDAYIYARPYFIEDGTLAFIMRDRLSHHNLHPMHMQLTCSKRKARAIVVKGFF